MGRLKCGWFLTIEGLRICQGWLGICDIKEKIFIVNRAYKNFQDLIFFATFSKR
jgi:hypothetical protein